MIGEINIIKCNISYDNSKWLECNGDLHYNENGKFDNLIQKHYGDYNVKDKSYRSPTIYEIFMKKYSDYTLDINNNIIDNVLYHRHEMNTPCNDYMNIKLYNYDINENISRVLYNFISKKNEIKLLIRYNI